MPEPQPMQGIALPPRAALERVARGLEGRIPDMGQDQVAQLLRDIANGRLIVVRHPRRAAA